MRAGDTFYVPSADEHLWIVISNPEVDPANVVTVNCTSRNPTKDQSCILKVGEHPFLTHDTCINYADAKVAPLDVLLRCEAANALVKSERVSDATLARIRDGTRKSLRQEALQILRNQGLVP